MVWKSFISQLAITSRRKVLVAAIVHAISAIVHFTPPIGDGTEIPTHSAQRTNPIELKNQTTGVNHTRLVILGAGFAGMYAALSAARLRDIQGVSAAGWITNAGNGSQVLPIDWAGASPTYAAPRGAFAAPEILWITSRSPGCRALRGATLPG
jgi:hypothetical protein